MHWENAGQAMWLVGPFHLPVLRIKPQFLGRLDVTVVTILAQLSHNNKEHHKWFSSTNIIQMTNTWRIKMVGSLTLTRKMKSKGRTRLITQNTPPPPSLVQPEFSLHCWSLP
jgi:hypothetical protein